MERKLQSLGRVDLLLPFNMAMSIIENPPKCYNCEHYWEEKTFCQYNNEYTTDKDTCDHFSKG